LKQCENLTHELRIIVMHTMVRISII